MRKRERVSAEALEEELPRVAAALELEWNSEESSLSFAPWMDQPRVVGCC